MNAKLMQKTVKVQDVAGADVEIRIRELTAGEYEAVEGKGMLAFVKAAVIPEDLPKLKNLSLRKTGGVRKLDAAATELTFGGEETQGN